MSTFTMEEPSCFRTPLSRISTRRKNVETRKVERIPTIRGSKFFRGDNSISQ